MWMQASDLDALNVIHITGTKGKGSTCAFVSSILGKFRAPRPDGSTSPLKVGLYTSPHIMEVRERIRIDGKPLERAAFARYFSEVWDKFESTKVRPLHFGLTARE